MFILICGTTYYEKIIAVVVAAFYCIVLIIDLNNKNNKIVLIIKCLFAILILLVLIASKTSYFGYFSYNNIKKRRADSFNRYMSNALYHYSLGNYDKSEIEFNKAAQRSSEEDKFECNCWLLENYKRNNSRITSSFLLKLNNIAARHNNNGSMNKYFPIIEMIDFYNNEEWSKMLELTKKFEYMDEKCIYLFKLLSLIKLDNSNIDKESFFELVHNLHSFKSSIKNIKSIENVLLRDIAFFLSENNSPFSILFYAELLSNGKSDFYNEFFNIVPKENNFFNIRFISADIYKYIQKVCINYYSELDRDIKSIYQTKLNNLFMYLGLIDLFESDKRIIYELNKIKNVDEELYNFIRIENNKYFFIKMKYESFENLNIFCEAKLYIVDTSNHPPLYENIDFFNSEFSLLMNKLFVVDYFNNQLLFEIIDGSGEYLCLYLVDLFNKTSKSLVPEDAENHHVSNVSFDFINTITYSTEVNNLFFANSENKVSGDVSLNINWDDFEVNYNINYSDPALQLFFNHKEFSFITPIVNRIKDNADNKVIDRLTGHDEIVLYSKIQESYNSFMKILNCKYSGLHLLYSDGNEQFHYFVIVKNDEEEIFVVDFYEVKDNALMSLLK